MQGCSGLSEVAHTFPVARVCIRVVRVGVDHHGSLWCCLQGHLKPEAWEELLKRYIYTYMRAYF